MVLGVAIAIMLSVLLVTSVVFYVCRYWLTEQHKSDSDHEDDQDDEVDGALAATEMVGLIHSSTSESKQRMQSNCSFFKSIHSLWIGTKTSKRTRFVFKKKRPVTRKYHKAQFFPVIDETVAWYADWEANNGRTATVIESSAPIIKPVSPRQSICTNVQAECDLFQGRKDKLRTISTGIGQDLLDIIHIPSPFEAQPHTAIAVS